MDRDDFNNQNGFMNRRDLGNNPYYSNGQNERRGFIDPSNPLGVSKNDNYTQPQGYPAYSQRPYSANIPPYAPIPNVPPQPINQPAPSMPIMYEQNQAQISNQDYEDQFIYGGQVQQPQSYIPQPQPVQPQPKKKGLFSFMNKKPQETPNNYVASHQYLNIQMPQSINDIKTIIDMIKAGDTVIVDFSKVNVQDSQRMVDFLSGGCYGAGGLMQSMGDRKFALTPPGTGIRGSLN